MIQNSPGAAVVKPATLTPELRKKAEVTVHALGEAKGQVQRIAEITREELEQVAERYTHAPSTFLAAIVGGVVGSAGGLALTTFAGTALLVTGPLGLAAGAALAVLAFRGRKHWRLERSSQKLRSAVDLVHAEIAGLTPDAPASVRNNLWQQYDRLMAKYNEIAGDSLDD
jgi:Flp pilus assembly protein TadB